MVSFNMYIKDTISFWEDLSLEMRRRPSTRLYTMAFAEDCTN